MKTYRYKLIYKKINGIVKNFKLEKLSYIDGTPKRTKLKISNLFIYDFDLGNYYAKKKISLRIKKIHNKLIDLITDEDDEDDDASVLSDIEALNALIADKYVDFLTSKYFLKIMVRINSLKMSNNIKNNNMDFDKFKKKTGRKM